MLDMMKCIHLHIFSSLILNKLDRVSVNKQTTWKLDCFMQFAEKKIYLLVTCLSIIKHCNWLWIIKYAVQLLSNGVILWIQNLEQLRTTEIVKRPHFNSGSHMSLLCRWTNSSWELNKEVWNGHAVAVSHINWPLHSFNSSLILDWHVV